MPAPSPTLSEVIASGASRPKSKAMLLAEAIQALTWPLDLERPAQTAAQGAKK